MEDRLEQLREEYRRGQEQLALLDRRRQELQETLLRISGAVQVLEELTETHRSGEKAAGCSIDEKRPAVVG